jgi:ABC-type branched-subunit amino acid transport system ATPase component/ABC-type branched-subunit amino acid transport system permease subunit
MTSQALLQFALIGLGTGAIYALTAQAVVLVYRGSGILNFASGAIGMVGAELFYELHDGQGVPLPLALAAGIAAPALISVTMQVGVLSRMRSSTGLSKLIATVGLFSGLVAVGLEVFGGEFRIARSILPQEVTEIAEGVRISEDRWWLLAIALALTVALGVLYRTTRFGLATSAVAENEDALAALGRSPGIVAALNWCFGGMIAGLAAILLAGVGGGPGLMVVDLSLVVIPALAAALIGSFRSFELTFLGAIVIGVLQAELAYVASTDVLPEALRTPGLPQAVPFLVIIVVLVARGRALPLRDERGARPARLGTGRVRWGTLLVVTVAAGAAIWSLLDVQWVAALTVTMVTAIVCLSLVVVTGFTGQLSLAQFTLAGVAAWIAVRVTDAFGVPFVVALAVGMLGVIPVGLLAALPSLRVRGVNLAVSTLGVALALDALVLRNNELTLKDGFANFQVPAPSLFGLDLDPVRHPERYATMVFVVFVVLAVMVANLRRGRAARRLLAVRTNERAAASLGISVFGAKLAAFAIGAAIAGAGGVLLAFTTRTVLFAGTYGVQASLNAVVYAVIGGIGFVIGPLFGTLLVPAGAGAHAFDELGDWIGVDLTGVFAMVGGFLLLLVLVANPDGLAADATRTAARVTRRVRNIVLREPDAIAESGEPSGPPATIERAEPRTLAVEHLTVRFGGVVALDDVSLTVEPGSVVGLIGPNGAGKTTLIDAVTGLVRTQAGTTMLAGTPLRRGNATARARRGIGRSFQSLELFEDMTVRDNLRTACDPRDRRAYLTDLVCPRQTPLSSLAWAAVREFGLTDDLDRLPQDLPFGRRRLVGIARAVATGPSVLLLDEPAAGLDDSETRELGDLVRRLAATWGLAVLLVEHDVGMVLATCDRIVALDFGRVIAEGTPDEIRADLGVVTAYLGAREPVGAP